MLIEYQLRIRNAADSADALAVTSVPGGTNPYLAEGEPAGDGETIDPRTGETTFGQYTFEILDPSIGSMQRLVTSVLEDAGGRPQLGHRIAIGEFRIDGGAWTILINGLLTGLRRVDGGKWSATVGDPLHALTLVRLFGPRADVLVADFLEDWPTRGCVLGGPIIGGGTDAMNIADQNGWLMRVQTAGPNLGPNEYGLQPILVYGAPTWEPNAAPTPLTITAPNKLLAALQDAINDAASQVATPPVNGAASPWNTIGDVLENGYVWRNLVTLIDGVPWKPLPVYDADTPVGGGVQRNLLVASNVLGDFVMRVKSDGVKTLTDGQLVHVRVITALPTEISPLYVSGHVIDLLIRFWDAAGIAYSATACADLKDLLGHDAVMTLRITSVKQLTDLVRTLCLRDGIGLRSNDAGEIEPFDARLGRSTDDPLATITDDDVVDGSVRPHDYDPSEAIRSVTFRSKFFLSQRSVPARRNDVTIVDGVAVLDQETAEEDPDPGALFGDLEISIDAMLHLAANFAPRVRDILLAVARRIFDRWGRGSLGAEMTLLRGGVGDSLRLGDEVMVDLSQMPNHNYLLGDNPSISPRAMQIVRRTVRAIGYDVKLVDSGVGLQPPSTEATVSIAVSADLPRTVAEATIDNAATLNGAGYGARLQIAFTDDGTDADPEKFTDLLAWAPAHIPTGAIRLPPVVAGTTVQVRVRTELAGARPTAWSALDKVTLDGIPAPTDLVATPDPSDGSRCLIEWTPANTTDLVDVFLRRDGEDDHHLTKYASLDGGSVRYEFVGLDPDTDYIATLQHRDPNSQDGGARPDVSFTTSASGITLNAPVDPAGFSGSPTLGRLLGASLTAGKYGIAVVATEVPGQVEIAEAVEDAPGAGTYGAFAPVATVPSVSGNWTTWQWLAPNDQRRRKLKARHIGDGTTESAYCAAVVVMPWDYLPLPAYPGDALLELKVTPLTPTAPDRFAFRLTPRDPLPTGFADLGLDFDVESGLVLYEYNTTTPAAPVSAASGDDLDYEAIRPLAGQGAKSTSWRVTKSGRRVGLSGPIVVPELPPGDTALDPQFTDASISSVVAPCDGSGGGDFSFTVANMPGTETYNLSWVVLTGTYAGLGNSDTGISNPYAFLAALCSGARIRFVISAIDGGDEIATGVFEFDI